MPIPVICKWFNKSADNELTEIEGISGAFYQPCAEDVGSMYNLMKFSFYLYSKLYSYHMKKIYI